MSVCDDCGQTVEIGEWPFCPHGYGGYSPRVDSIRGGQLIENLGPTPIPVYSESERKRIMKERGLVDFVRHAPLPGTDKSALTTNWATASALTLQNGADLVSGERRQRTTASDPETQLETLVLTVREREDGFRVSPDGEPHT